MNIWYYALMWFIQTALIFAQVFRFHYFWAVASILICWPMSNIAGVPMGLNIAAWFIGWAQILSAFLVFAFGSKTVKTHHLY